MKRLSVDSLSQGDPFLELIDRLGDLDAMADARVRPLIAEVRARLSEAATARQQGNVPGALEIIGQAMARLAGQADAAQGGLMGAIAQSFAQAMNAGARSNTRRRAGLAAVRAGDGSKDKDSDR